MDEHANQAGELLQQVDGLIAKTRAETQEAFVKMQRNVELLVGGAKAQMGSANAHGGEAAGPAVARVNIDMSSRTKSPFFNYQKI